MKQNKKTKKQQDPHKRAALPFRKWRLREKRGQENGPKAEKDKTERATGLGRRTREEITYRKMGSN